MGVFLPVPVVTLLWLLLMIGGVLWLLVKVSAIERHLKRIANNTERRIDTREVRQ
jgi:hypothetical protein